MTHARIIAEKKGENIMDSLGTRMKKFYEDVSKTKLMRRQPVIIRIDGRAFHTFCKGFQEPFDEVLIKSMQDTTKYLCENIQGCVLGYTQSDEITLVLIDYQTLESSAWFDYEVQKLCSISASMATMAFNRAFANNVQDFVYDCCYNTEDGNLGDYMEVDKINDYDRYENAYRKSLERGAMFDARAFNIPKEEVTNCVYWRQLDASRNSIQMVGQANFAHKELQSKSCNDIQDMLFTQKGINWNNLPKYQKRGSCCIKNTLIKGADGDKLISDDVKEGKWFIDKNIPIFYGDGRTYIDRLVLV